jgi:hypothetical protein
MIVGHWWLTPITYLLRRQRSEGSRFKARPGRELERPYLEKPITIKG